MQVLISTLFKSTWKLRHKDNFYKHFVHEFLENVNVNITCSFNLFYMALINSCELQLVTQFFIKIQIK